MATDDSPDVHEGTARLADFLRERVGDDLRSVIWYDRETYEIIYSRDGVLDEYSDEELEDVIEELTLTSLMKPVKEGIYTHGELECLVECFEDGIEMHFVVGDGEGIAIGLEAQAFVTHQTFIGKCMEEVGLE